MNKLNFVRNNNGVIKLPPGFRFQPTDEELVFEYLRRKVFSCPLPSSSDIIPEINLCKYDPWDLPFSGDMERDMYFFCNKEVKYQNGSNRANRKTGSGYWKATGSEKKIVSSELKHVVGTRKTLVFYGGKPPQGSRTDWFMHEYTIKTTDISTQQASQNQAENWVVCRIFLKERSTKVDNNNNNNNYNYDNRDENVEQNWECNNYAGKFLGTNYKPRKFDLVMRSGIDVGPARSSSSSPSSSSSGTEVSSSYACHGEGNNGYPDF